MSDKVKILTLSTKIEFMVLALGGKPDEEKIINENYVKQLTETGKEIKTELGKAAKLLGDRNETIACFGYNSKERVVIDEDIKGIFNSSE
jgi:hypothetical protein